jgi:NTP pyrophosphatase (non-canonical NTP hydrolase)
MGFRKYQEFVESMPDFDDAALGLPGEVGEVLELVKKDRRTGEYRQPLDHVKFTAELGDVLFYLTRLAYKNGIDLKDIADYNVHKLTKRHG